MKDRLFLIDGMAYAFRAYYAIRTSLTDGEGNPTNALYGFTRVLLKLIRDHEPTHLAVVFDAPGKNAHTAAHEATHVIQQSTRKLQTP